MGFKLRALKVVYLSLGFVSVNTRYLGLCNLARDRTEFAMADFYQNDSARAEISENK